MNVFVLNGKFETRTVVLSYCKGHLVKDLVNEFDQFSNGLILALEKIIGNSYWVKYVRIRVRQNMRSGCNSLACEGRSNPAMESFDWNKAMSNKIINGKVSLLGDTA